MNIIISDIYNFDYFKQLDKTSQFKSLLDQFCTDMRQVGYKLVPYKNLDFSKFAAMNPAQQNKILNDFLIYYNCFVAASRDRITPIDSRSILWYFLKERGWTPSSDLFSYIKENDIVEVYGADFIQIFRNLSFFDFCSYSLYDLFINEWPSLFKRSDQHTMQLVNAASKLVTGQIKNTIVPEVQEHTIEELFSENMNIFSANHKALSPVFDKSKRPVGFIGVTEARIVGQGEAHSAQIFAFSPLQQ